MVEGGGGGDAEGGAGGGLAVNVRSHVEIGDALAVIIIPNNAARPVDVAAFLEEGPPVRHKAFSVREINPLDRRFDALEIGMDRADGGKPRRQGVPGIQPRTNSK